MNKCCEQSANRMPVEADKDRKVEICTVCDRKHYQFFIDPIRFGLVGSEL